MDPGIALRGIRNEVYQVLTETLADLYKAEDPSALVLRVHIQRMLGKYEIALNEIKEALCLNQNHTYALEIRNKL